MLGKALAAGAAAAAAAAVLRRRRAVAERVDLYYEDGSLVSLAEGSEEAAQLLTVAADVLRAAR